MTPRWRGTARVKRNWWAILLLTMLGAGAGYASSLLTDSVYQASSTLLVGRSLTDADVNQDTIETSQRLAATYADLVGRQPVLEGAAQQLGLDVPWQELRSRVNASVPRQDSPLVVIHAEAASASEAIALAGAVDEQVIALSPTTTEDEHVSQVRAFVEARLLRTQQLISSLEVRTTRLKSLVATATGPRLQGVRAHIAENETHLLDLQQNYASLLSFVSSGGVTNYIEVLEPPEAGSEPVRPNVVLDVAEGAVVGCLVGVVVAYLIGWRGRSPRDEGQHGSTSGSIHPSDADRSALQSGTAEDPTGPSEW